MKTYRLETIADLLKVPAERRTACLRQLHYFLSFHELAHGDTPAEMRGIIWTDDGDMSCEIPIEGGQVLRLEIDGQGGADD